MKAGFYETEYGRFPKLQILTIADLFAGKRPQLPWLEPKAFKKAPRERLARGRPECRICLWLPMRA